MLMCQTMWHLTWEIKKIVYIFIVNIIKHKLRKIITFLKYNNRRQILSINNIKGQLIEKQLIK